MNNKVDIALERLKGVLPLKQSQEACEPEIKNVYQQLLKSFITSGRALSKEEMSHHIDDTDLAIAVLSKCDMASFFDNGEPRNAYPFSSTERDYLIQVNGYSVYAMCALDSLAIAPMFNVMTHITSHCKITGEQIDIRMRGAKVLNIKEMQDIYMGVSWSDADASKCCADSLCKEIVFLCDRETAQQWLSDTAVDGELFTLLEATQFASRFFVPLMH